MTDLRTKVRDAIAQTLGYSAYDCTRVWDAWNVGTMDRDDFVKIVDDESRLDEIADAAMSALTERIERLEEQNAALLAALKGLVDRISGTGFQIAVPDQLATARAAIAANEVSRG